jgi:hypothetical protein
MTGWTLTADVRIPTDWFTEAGTTWRSLPPGTPQDEVLRVMNEAFAKAREGWAEYVRRLMARYPVFKEMVKAPDGTNVPWRLQTTEPVTQAQPQPQQEPTVLETLARIMAQPVQPALLMPLRTETVTLTRQQLNLIVTCISGKSITDDQWAVFHGQYAS